VFEGKPELIPVKGNPKRLRVSIKIRVEGKDRQLISCRDGANEKVDVGTLRTPFPAGERAELGLQFPELGLVGDPR
jgi:hypothetical protein